MPLRDEASAVHVLYAVTFGTMSATHLNKYALHVSTDHMSEDVENVMSSICANRAKAFPNFNWLLFRDDPSGFDMLYAIAFVWSSSTRLHKHAIRGLTDWFAQKFENVMSSICPNDCSHLNF